MPSSNSPRTKLGYDTTQSRSSYPKMLQKIEKKRRKVRKSYNLPIGKKGGSSGELLLLMNKQHKRCRKPIEVRGGKEEEEEVSQCRGKERRRLRLSSNVEGHICPFAYFSNNGRCKKKLEVQQAMVQQQIQNLIKGLQDFARGTSSFVGTSSITGKCWFFPFKVLVQHSNQLN